jgi:hypothetical protein
MKRKTVMGVHAPPPRPTRLLCAALFCGGLILVVLLGLAFDPFLRWLIGLG